LQLENLSLRQRHQESLEKINRLKADPSEVERVARERYNFARPGDIIVNLQD
jgi:cell division protein FtsB